MLARRRTVIVTRSQPSSGASTLRGNLLRCLSGESGSATRRFRALSTGGAARAGRGVGRWRAGAPGGGALVDGTPPRGLPASATASDTRRRHRAQRAKPPPAPAIRPHEHAHDAYGAVAGPGPLPDRGAGICRVVQGRARGRGGAGDTVARHETGGHGPTATSGRRRGLRVHCARQPIAVAAQVTAAPRHIRGDPRAGSVRAERPCTGHHCRVLS